MNILALDLGTKTGWALYENETIRSGTWELDRKHRWSGLWTELAAISVPILGLVWEDVRRHRGTCAAHVYGGLVAICEMWAESAETQTGSIGVGTIKKHATGKGNATKAMMLEAARERWPEQNVVDDNQADALWLLDVWRERNEAGG